MPVTDVPDKNDVGLPGVLGERMSKAAFPGRLDADGLSVLKDWGGFIVFSSFPCVHHLNSQAFRYGSETGCMGSRQVVDLRPGKR